MARPTISLCRNRRVVRLLNRLGKRVDFVRYVGEEPAIESPENIRELGEDFWLV